MSSIRKLLESLDAINEVQDTDAEKQQAFNELGLDEHQWDVFSLTWDTVTDPKTGSK